MNCIFSETKADGSKKGARLQSSTSWVASCVILLFINAQPAAAFCPPINSNLFVDARLAPARTNLVLQARAESKEKGTGRNAHGGNKGRSKKKKYKVKPWETARRTPESLIRPVLGNVYADNIAPETNQQRLCGSINCEHFDVCSGCMTEDKVGEVSVVQSAKAFFSSPWIREKMIQRPSDYDDFFEVIIPAPLTAWRTQAKLVAAPKSTAWAKDGCTFGLYRKRTHKVEPIPNCEVHHPSINRAIALLEQATKKVGNSAYDEERREGGLR